MYSYLRNYTLNRIIRNVGDPTLTPTIYVSVSGNDTTGDGSISSPYRTIGKAESESVSGDVIALERAQEWFERISPKTGVGYTSYGEGDLPLVYGGHQRLVTTDWTDNGDGTWDTNLNSNSPAWLPKDDIGKIRVGAIVNIPNLIVNDNGRIFTSSTSGWGLSVAGAGTGTKNHSATEGFKALGSMNINITNAGTTDDSIRIATSTGFHSALTTDKGKTYILEFYAKASVNFEGIKARLMDSSFNDLSTDIQYDTINVGTTWKRYKVIFNECDSAETVRLELWAGNTTTGDLYFDDFVIYADSDIEVYGDLKELHTELLEDMQFSMNGDATSSSTTVRVKSATNPATRFTNFYITTRDTGFNAFYKSNIILEDIDVRYWGGHGIYTSGTDNITVRRCRSQFIGGSYLFGTTKYGNSYELWEGGNGIRFLNNYARQCYDSAITFQGNSQTYTIENVVISGNVTEECYQGFEFWVNDASLGDTSIGRNIIVTNNTFINNGYSWSADVRPDGDKGWGIFNYKSGGTLENIKITNNTFAGCRDGVFALETNASRTINDKNEITMTGNKVWFTSLNEILNDNDVAENVFMIREIADYEAYEPLNQNIILTNKIQDLYSIGKGVYSVDNSDITIRKVSSEVEKSFSPTILGLDTTGITEFLQSNILDGSSDDSYTNFLADNPLGIGTGLSSGWSFTESGTGVLENTIVNGKQRVDVTVNSADKLAYIYPSGYTQVIAGDSISLSLKIKTENLDRLASIRFAFYIDGVYNSVSSNVTYVGTEEETVLLENIVVPAGINNVRPLLYNFQNVAGGTGYIEYSDIRLIKNPFAKNIGLLTSDSDSDGVADGFVRVDNPACTNVLEVTGDGQKITTTNVTGFGAYNGVILPLGVLALEPLKTYRVNIDYNVLSVQNLKARVYLFEYDTSNFNVWNSYTQLTTVGEGRISFDVTTKNDTVQGRIGLYQITEGYDSELTYEMSTIFKNVTLQLLNDSATVTQINDYSGNGNHATQPNATSQPLLVDEGVFVVNSDGGYAMSLDGVDDYMVSDFGETLSQPNTIFSNAEKVKNATQFLYDGIIGSKRNALWQDDVLISLYAGVSSTTNISDYTNKMTSIFNGASSKLYDDNNNVVITGDVGNYGLSGITIGNHVTVGLFFGGKISDIAVFDLATSHNQIKLLNGRFSR